MNALPLWSHPTLKKEDYAYFECSDKIHFPRNQWEVQNLLEAPTPICLSFTNRFSQTISGSIEAQYQHDVDDTIFVPNWMYALLTTTDNLTVGFLCRQNCTHVTMRPQDPYLLTSDWMSRLPSSFTGYVTIQRYTTIPIWYDSRIIKVFIEDIQPNVDTVILQTQKAANVVLLPPCPVDDEFFRKFMNNRNQVHTVYSFFIPFSGTAYSLKKQGINGITIQQSQQSPKVEETNPLESDVLTVIALRAAKVTKAEKEHAELFLQGLAKRSIDSIVDESDPWVPVQDVDASASKVLEPEPEAEAEQEPEPECTHAQLFLAALKERQTRRQPHTVELRMNMLEIQKVQEQKEKQEVQTRSKEEIERAEFMALVARGRKDGNFAKIHKEYLMKKYNVVVHKK